MAINDTTPGGRRPFHLMVKPIGPICNLNCRYCYYLAKEKHYPAGENFRMSDSTLEQYISQYAGSLDSPEIAFSWQGGEPLLMGLDFFRRAVELENKHAGGRRVMNAIQTNGTMLDDEWCEFFKANNFLVGISVDGPRELHDFYRKDKRGKPTFGDVMRGVDVLRKHAVDFNALTVVNRYNGRHPLKVYEFLKSAGFKFVQFIPIVERPTDPAPGEVKPFSVEPEQWGRFLVGVFDQWVRHDVGKVFVQYFDAALGIWAGAGASICVFAEKCGHAMAMEHNGDVFACDHFVDPEYRRGNLSAGNLREMLDSPEQRKFGDSKADLLPGTCKRCEVRFVCNGGCIKHRFATTADGEPGLNYLCSGYRMFFTHIGPYMDAMARLLREGRPPAEIMGMLKRQE